MYIYINCIWKNITMNLIYIMFEAEIFHLEPHCIIILSCLFYVAVQVHSESSRHQFGGFVCCCGLFGLQVCTLKTYVLIIHM